MEGHAAVTALGWCVGRAAALAALAPARHGVVVQLVLAAAARYSAAAHGQVSKAGAGAALHPAAHLLGLQLPPSVRAVAVPAHAARRRAHVVAVGPGGVAPRSEQFVLVACSRALLRQQVARVTSGGERRQSDSLAAA